MEREERPGTVFTNIIWREKRDQGPYSQTSYGERRETRDRIQKLNSVGNETRARIHEHRMDRDERPGTVFTNIIWRENRDHESI